MSINTKTAANLATTIILTSLLAASACSSSSSDQNKSESIPKPFPASQSRDQAAALTSMVPTAVLAPVAMADEAPSSAVLASVEPSHSEVAPEPAKFSEWMNRAKIRSQKGDQNGALADYEKAASARPASFRAQIQFARTLLSMSEVSRAREYAEAALEIKGDSSLALNTMGRIELAEHDNEAAILSFTRATDENSDNSYAWNNLGFVLMEEGLYEEAATALEQATTGGTPKPYMWNNLGMAYEHLDKISLARASYREARDEGSAKALANFDRLDGVTSLIAAARPGPDGPESKVAKGDLYEQQEDAVEVVEQNVVVADIEFAELAGR